MDRYPPIAEHGLIGDLQTAALVSSRGVIDWFAAPRFDSPSVFAALLDHDRGGYLLFAPPDRDAVCKQLYYPDTAVLVTRFMSPAGVGEVIDCMPPDTALTPTDRHTVMRLVRAVRGTVRFALECRPRFDYGRALHDLDMTPAAAVFRAPAQTGYLQATSLCGATSETSEVRSHSRPDRPPSPSSPSATPEGSRPPPSYWRSWPSGSSSWVSSGRTGCGPPATGAGGRPW